jgi:hypothetical protein
MTALLSMVYDNLPSYKEELDKVWDECPEECQERQILLNIFLGDHMSYVDIAVILNEGLSRLCHIAPYIDMYNLLLFQPRTNHHHEKRSLLLEGIPNPERTLLLVDEDMVSGNTLKEAKTYFTALGYDPTQIYAFLITGCESSAHKPLLGQVDEVISKANQELEHILSEGKTY